mmetsp:Transcript_30584/g.56549  ORF Transcript_30584/g.56549 Transcript_30584/m.56549 type:complete len:181 (-) Transcript_30584:2253-2795(-)
MPSTMNAEQDAAEVGLSLVERERRRGAEITQNEDASADDDGALSHQEFDNNEVDASNATGAPSGQRKQRPAPGAGGATAYAQQPNLVPASASQQTNTALPFPPVIENPIVAAPQTPQSANANAGGIHPSGADPASGYPAEGGFFDTTRGGVVGVELAHPNFGRGAGRNGSIVGVTDGCGR